MHLNKRLRCSFGAGEIVAREVSLYGHVLRVGTKDLQASTIRGCAAIEAGHLPSFVSDTFDRPAIPFACSCVMTAGILRMLVAEELMGLDQNLVIAIYPGGLRPCHLKDYV